MARKSAAKSSLRTATARNGLAQRKAPYSERLGTGIALLYWKGKGGGSWKSRTPGAGDRVIGPADDGGVLGGISYADAVARVLEISKSEKDGHAAALTSNKTAGDYLNAYLLSARTSKDPRGVNTISGHVKLCAPIAGKKPTALTLLDLNAWRDGLVVDGERTRSTVNKVIATLKAALNAGGAGGDHWRRLKKFADSDGTREEVFTADELRRLIVASYEQTAGLGRMVEALALTGCRYGELVDVRVKDLGTKTLFVTGKTGPRTLTLTKRGAEFFAGFAQGKEPGDLLLEQEDGSPFIDGSIRKSSRPLWLPLGWMARPRHMQSGTPTSRWRYIAACPPASSPRNAERRWRCWTRPTARLSPTCRPTHSIGSTSIWTSLPGRTS